MKKFLLFVSGILFSTTLISQASILSVTNTSCYGLCNGAITISITGGTMPYSVSTNTLSGGCQISAINNIMSNTITIGGLCGTCYYFFNVYDALSNWVGGAGAPVLSPNILLINVSPNPIICYGQTAQIFASGSGGTPPYSFTWNPPSFVGGGPHTVSPTTITQYTTAISDANGCVAAPQIITVNVRPPLLASGYLIVKCDGSSTVLTPSITSTGNGGPYVYSWSEGSSTNTIAVIATYSSSPNSYSVIISDGCTVPSATANFTVYVNPTPSYTPILTQPSCSTCCNGSVQLSGTCGSGTSSCTFYLNPGGISTPTASSLCSGVYSYGATNAYGCMADITFTLGSVIGIKEAVSNFEFNIYPNPSDGNITFITSQDFSQLNYEIFDIVGNKLNSGRLYEKISLGQISEGLFLFKIKNADGTTLGRKKIIINH